MWYTPPPNNVSIPKGERVPVFTTFVGSSSRTSENLVLSLSGGKHAHDVEIVSGSQTPAIHKLFPEAALHIRLVASSVTVTVVGSEADSIQVKLAFAPNASS